MSTPMSNDVGELVRWLKMQEESANQNAVECVRLGMKLKAGVWTDRAAKYSAAATALSSQAAEIAELRLALGPFAKAAEKYPLPHFKDEFAFPHPIWGVMPVTVGDLRRAALAKNVEG